MHLLIKLAVLSVLTLFFVVGIISISQSETIDDLVEREALFYLKFTDTPFSGELEGIQQGRISEGKKQSMSERLRVNRALFQRSKTKQSR